MVKFDKFILDNGLKVIVNTDTDTPLVAFNLLYNVGAKDEEPDKTGFAHLFEHLMFGGSKNVPSFDEPLQMAGGENNAFTNNDITNYYITLPKENIETAFWIESDRMLELDFSEKSLAVQQNVVIEEYKQRYLNQPYGDVWLKLRPLVYKIHPYMWPTIGKDISHIQNANLDDVRKFFYGHYAPDNAILGISGNITTQEVKYLCDKWFAPIEKRNVPARHLPGEPVQTEQRKLMINGKVPYDAIYKVYHSSSRLHKEYPSSDLTSDILSGGKSARLYLKLVKEKKMFSELDAYVTGDIEPGLFVIAGKLMKGIKPEEAETAINIELEKICAGEISDYEINKVKNKFESGRILSETNALNKAMNLSFYELLGDAGILNSEVDQYFSVSKDDISAFAQKIFRPENCSTMYYLSSVD